MYIDVWFPILIIAFLLAGAAQMKVSSAYNKYSRVPNRRGISGEEVAAQMLQNAGIFDVRIERIAGNLTDHYDPRTKTLRLSAGVYGGRSIAALGIAAHETGHAIQHDRGYVFLALRSMMVPLSNLGSTLAFPLILIGLLFGGHSASLWITLGIAFYALAVLFTLITLPVEFNASARALDMLEDQYFLDSDEMPGARKVLSAAAMTYVAAAAVAVLQLLRLISIFGRRND
ncbi:zinc metallopeptidase [Anaerotignum lactatifermentans]|uniref:Zinc metallopeptidase n=1 Tax=Anaerotignum lactatifermentans TaxID=160404 RepID=A0ABS2G929_9FIRM|nr:zinc metallopeptidase [Anaerotignum lactatifermentans]MBM6829732.1 zinc metallopeptidase [Anaerotignum lactatifermentans]MBM6877153.1 zinc metallopeptidase [Anaerotignum lactatifermentans]MBM6951391.1 zinc metallopeptidase [Anaerotignum lactatifermentans]